MKSFCLGHLYSIRRNLLGPLVVVACLFAGQTRAQEVVQKSIKVDGKSVSYSVLQPTGSASKGILLLFPGKGENPKSVFKKTTLPGILAAQGYTTIVPNLKYALFADDLAKIQISTILKTEGEGLSVPLVIGGFSAGGAVALSYAEHIVSQGPNYLKSVFAIDPPLDLQRLYASSRLMRRYNCPSVQSEAQGNIDYLDKAMGGSPDDQYANYVANSPYMASEADGGNAKWLRQIPIRLYSEPDVDFVKQRHCAEIERTDLNVGDLEKLAKDLKKSGNSACELVVTKDRGYHSWDIADPEELASWIAKF